VNKIVGNTQYGGNTLVRRWLTLPLFVPRKFLISFPLSAPSFLDLKNHEHKKKPLFPAAPI